MVKLPIKLIAVFALGLVIGVSTVELVAVAPLQTSNSGLIKAQISLQTNMSYLNGKYNELLSNYTALKAVKPQISMVDITRYNARRNESCVDYQLVGADFTLVNTGKTNGIAKVMLINNMNPTPMNENFYFVPAESQVQKILKVKVSCYSYFDVGLTFDVSGN